MEGHVVGEGWIKRNLTLAELLAKGIVNNVGVT